MNSQLNNKPALLGVFDSGVGGLSVLKEIIKQLPGEDVLYLGDTARIPYGGRPVKEIIAINKEILNYFARQKVDMVIMACGTSSAIAYPMLKEEYPFPIISLIEPGAKAALSVTCNLKIGILATVGTVQSGAYQNTIHSLNPNAKVIAEGCPLFVPMIEGGRINTEETKKIAIKYLTPLVEEKTDTIILGCTHYPHLSFLLQKIVGSDVVLVDPGVRAVVEAKNKLNKIGLLGKREKDGQYRYVVTGSASHFEKLGQRLLGKKISSVKQIQL